MDKIEAVGSVWGLGKGQCVTEGDRLVGEPARILRSAVVALIIAAFAISVPLQTSTAQPVKEGSFKVGFVDMEEAFNGYLKTKTASNEVDAEFNRSNEEMKAKKQDIAKLREEIEQKEAILTEERLGELKDQLSQRQLELRLFAQKAQSDLDRLERKKTMEIIDEIENAVKEIGTKEGFDLIFKKRHLLWGSPALDLTGSVLDILNKQEGT